MSGAAEPVPAGVALLRRRIAVSGTAVCAGIASSVAVDATLGGYVTTASLAWLVWSLHRFGRTGPG